MYKELVRRQFNKQARNFSEWAVTGNTEYLERYFGFCGIRRDDTLLDVACGTGELSIFAAERVGSVLAVDISDKPIEIATVKAESRNLQNVKFVAHDVDSKIISCSLKGRSFSF